MGDTGKHIGLYELFCTGSKKIKGQKGRVMVKKIKFGVKSNKFDKAIFGGTLPPLLLKTKRSSVSK